jgi:hypothetical protein
MVLEFAFSFDWHYLIDGVYFPSDWLHMGALPLAPWGAVAV